MHRRDFLRAAALGGAVLPNLVLPGAARAAPARAGRGMITITINLEMSRHFPLWRQTHWDYEKGNLDQDNKRYAVEAARFVKQRGGRITFFVVGQVLEHESVAWLEEIHREGHPIANHTYDHVNLLADRPEELQFRFRRAPWLVEGRTAQQVVEENIRMTNSALRHRLGIEQVRGFRASNEYENGLDDKPRIQAMLQRLGFDWVGTKWFPFRLQPAERPSEAVFARVAAAQANTQPYLYPNGLVEIPKSPATDVAAFRNGRWGVADYLEMVRRGAQWAIDNGAVYTFVAHSSVLLVTDPQFRVLEMLCDLAAKGEGRAELVTPDTIADRVRARALPG